MWVFTVHIPEFKGGEKLHIATKNFLIIVKRETLSCNITENNLFVNSVVNFIILKTFIVDQLILQIYTKENQDG